jgi:uncharacterized protein (TIGR02217 family)
MQFVEVKFPDSISFNSSSISEFNTDVITMKNGLEQRNINWSKCRLKYNVVNGIKTSSEILELISFFKVIKGRAIGFRYKDWTDYKAVGQVLGTGDGTSAEFQLVKKYSSGGVEYNRTITKPVSGSLTIYLDDVETTDYTIDLTTGVITFNTAVGLDVIVKADFEFDVPVRFNSDSLEISMESINSGKVKEIKLVEVRDR